MSFSSRQQKEKDLEVALRNTTRLKDVPAEWGWPRLEQVAPDACYGLRKLRRKPVFSVVSIATFALGIGGMAAMFSAFDTILIRPLPYADADRLVMIWDDMRNIDVTTKLMPAP